MSIEKMIGNEKSSVKVWSEWKIAAANYENDLSSGYESSRQILVNLSPIGLFSLYTGSRLQRIRLQLAAANSVNKAILINHWSINWYLVGCVGRSWTLTQKAVRLYDLCNNNFFTAFTGFSQNI